MFNFRAGYRALELGHLNYSGLLTRAKLPSCLVAVGGGEGVVVQLVVDVTLDSSRVSLHLYHVYSEAVWSVMEGCEGEGPGAHLIARALQQGLWSSKHVGLPREPVEVLVVEAAGQAAVGGAADLDGEVAGALYHPAGEAGASVGPHRLDPLSC